MEQGVRNGDPGVGEMRDGLEGILSFDLASLTVPPVLVAQQMAAHLGGRVPGLRDPALQRLLAQAIGLLARCGRASGLPYTMREAALLLPDPALQREVGCQVEEASPELPGALVGDPWPGARPLPGMNDLLREADHGRG